MSGRRHLSRPPSPASTSRTSFSQNDDTGFQNDSQPVFNVDRPNGIDWLLRNHDMYGAKTNYSHVWYRQVNTTGEAGEGKKALWVFAVYAFRVAKMSAPTMPTRISSPGTRRVARPNPVASFGQCRIPFEVLGFGLRHYIMRRKNARPGRVRHAQQFSCRCCSQELQSKDNLNDGKASVPMREWDRLRALSASVVPCTKAMAMYRWYRTLHASPLYAFT